MKSKSKTGSSKTPSQVTANKRKQPGTGIGGKINTAFLRKNEFALILLGALLLTLIIFFILFRPSGNKEKEISDKQNQTASFTELENRIAALEKGMIANDGKSLPGQPLEKTTQSIADIDKRVTRLETAFLVKFESVLERMESLEKQIAALKSSQNAAVKSSTVKTTASKPAPPVKKAVKKETKKPIFHTVVKGETLYSISKKYKTTVPVLRKLNNLSATDKIYPGNNIIVSPQ